MSDAPPLAKLRQDLKRALAAAPKEKDDLRHGLAHAIRAIERAESVDKKKQPC